MSTSVPRRRRACKLSQEHMSPHYNDTKASALCSEFIVLRVSIKGPGTLKGLVKFSGSPASRVPGAPGAPKTKGQTQAEKNQPAKEMEVIKMLMMKMILKVFNKSFPLHWKFFSSSTIFPYIWHPLIMAVF